MREQLQGSCGCSDSLSTIAPEMSTLFLYLAFGSRPDIPVQLKYSLFTLIQHVPSARGHIVLYTDAPHRFRHWPVELIELNRITEAHGKEITYPFLLKPLAVRHALATFGRPVLCLDTDTWVRPGFEADVFWKLESGAILNAFEKWNPYPALSGWCARLPHLGRYAYDPDRSWMYNSGLIGLKPDALRLLDDAIALIEALVDQRLGTHTLEQFAISEALRLYGVKVRECRRYVVHYHRRSLKRYVTSKLARIMPTDWDDFDIEAPPVLNGLEKRAHDLRHSLTKQRIRYLGAVPSAAEGN